MKNQSINTDLYSAIRRRRISLNISLNIQSAQADVL